MGLRDRGFTVGDLIVTLGVLILFGFAWSAATKNRNESSFETMQNKPTLSQGKNSLNVSV